MWLLHVTNGFDYYTWRMDAITTRDEWMDYNTWLLQHVTNGRDYNTSRMDVNITWQMDMITRDEWMWLEHVTNGYYNTWRMDMTNGYYNTWRMDMIITRDEWTWL